MPRCLMLVLFAVLACGREAPPPVGGETGASEPLVSAEPSANGEVVDFFVDATEQVGLHFEHQSGAKGDFHFPEINGAGAALFDADQDGDLDLYLVSSAPFPNRQGQLSDRLYRNDLEPGGVPRLVDITAESGLQPQGYGMGVAAGDIDNDGDVDLYLTNYGPDQLLLNRTGEEDDRIFFEDVTSSHHPGNRRWSTSASFVDVDRDGWLDLMVVNYVVFDPAVQPRCRSFLGGPDYCGPLAFASEPDRLYRNRGDGTFEDISGSAGLGDAVGNGLGVVSADFDANGWPDLYVANDQQPNHLWLHQGLDASGRATFENSALLAGVGVNREGQAEASMGVDAGDIDGDGDPDLFLTHLEDETNTLYRNDGQGLFVDTTVPFGLGAPSRTWTAFGTGFLDFDNDGWLDLFVANGAVTAMESLLQAKDPLPFHQPNQLFRNVEGRAFEEVSGQAGAAFQVSEVSRGAAFGDLDNDGDTDVVVLNHRGAARVLLNQVGSRKSWVGLRPLESPSGRDQLLARVEVRTSDGRTLWRRSRADGSYASASDPRVLVGLGDAKVEEITLHWSGGARERFSDLETGTYHDVVQGTGAQIGDGGEN